MFSGRLFTSKIRIDECAELLGLKSVPTVKVGPFGTWQEDEDCTSGRCSQRVPARRPTTSKATSDMIPGRHHPPRC